MKRIVGTVLLLAGCSESALGPDEIPSPGPPTADCESGEGLALAVGESHTATAASPLCLAANLAGTSEYVVVPFHATTAEGTLQVEIAGEGMVEPPQTARVLQPASTPLPEARHRADMAAVFDRQLRQREVRELGPLTIRGPGGLRPSFSLDGAPMPAIGDTLRLNVNSDEACTERIESRARVRAVSDQAILLEDIDNPAGGFAEADYRAIGLAFDELVYPTITHNFGAPTDIDGNGRVLILFTKAVNELTPADSESFVGGFFFARDLFPTTTTSGFSSCQESNYAELLYMMVPDPGGTINGNARTRETVSSRSLGVLGHELQHLINASRRLRVLEVTNFNEESWLNEGMSHIAEELLFFAATPHAPGENITLEALRRDSVILASFNRYQAVNFGRFSEYLRAPSEASPLRGADLAARGASWAFLRYAADRWNGSDEAVLWRRLVDSNATGIANLENAFGVDPLEWMHDWTVALYTDDLVSTGARFDQPSWDYRSILPALTTNEKAFPLRVRELGPGSSGAARLDLAAAGADVLKFAVPAGDRSQIRITSSGEATPPTLRITIVRIG